MSTVCYLKIFSILIGAGHAFLHVVEVTIKKGGRDQVSHLQVSVDLGRFCTHNKTKLRLKLVTLLRDYCGNLNFYGNKYITIGTFGS
jgi:hypothetical protein